MTFCLFVVTFIAGTAVLITCMLIFGQFGASDHLQHCQQSALGQLLCCPGASLSALQQVHHSSISILHWSAVPMCAFWGCVLLSWLQQIGYSIIRTVHHCVPICAFFAVQQFSHNIVRIVHCCVPVHAKFWFICIHLSPCVLIPGVSVSTSQQISHSFIITMHHSVVPMCAFFGVQQISHTIVRTMQYCVVPICANFWRICIHNTANQPQHRQHSAPCQTPPPPTAPPVAAPPSPHRGRPEGGVHHPKTAPPPPWHPLRPPRQARWGGNCGRSDCDNPQKRFIDKGKRRASSKAQ